MCHVYEQSFTEKPNLPDGTVSSVIISEKYTDIITELERLGVSVISSPPVYDIAGAEKYHADISAVHLGGENIICAGNNRELFKKLQDAGFYVIPSENYIVGSYPGCTALNAVITERGIICRKNSVDGELLNYFGNDLPVINVNQGYARCSTAVVSDNAVITSDVGIYNACLKNGIDALKISSGDIEIEGYGFGFIGGACGKLSRDILAFCGRIEAHRDYGNIKGFALNYGVHLLSLSGRTLFDVGGVLPVMEKQNV